MANSTIQTINPFLKAHETKTSSGCTLKSYSHDTGSGPVVCLVHGWPESSYMWRHIVPLIKDKMTLFVPELPGYGFSTLPPKPDKRTTGNIIIGALQSTFGKDRPVIWCGHDRGARVGHRLLVDNVPSHNIKAAILLDIVPTVEQWRSFANPIPAIAYYHWPLLAAPWGPALIESMGGAEYIQHSFDRMIGKNPEGAARIKANDAIEHYRAQFSKSETIKGSCADYASAAGDEQTEQIKDQEEGRKIKVPTLVAYSASNLGRMHDVPKVWANWYDGDEFKCVDVDGGFGHFFCEEDPERTARLIVGWVESHSG